MPLDLEEIEASLNERIEDLERQLESLRDQLQTIQNARSIADNLYSEPAPGESLEKLSQKDAILCVVSAARPMTPKQIAERLMARGFATDSTAASFAATVHTTARRMTHEGTIKQVDHKGRIAFVKVEQPTK